MDSCDQTTCRVGICDDVESFRRVVSLVFDTVRDIEVIGQAAHGRAAVDLVASGGVDVLLLDISMPIMDGMEALPLIRDAAPDTKVIMLTGYGTQTLREQALAAGASRFIEKGTALPDLIGMVREVCASDGAEASPASR